jgi:ABC-type antimicrobial peptide transport system permease subunit
MVLHDALALAGTGLAIGLFVAIVLACALRSFLYRVSPIDPASYAIAPALFLLTAFVAAYFPSRRATRVDPVIALRQE